VRYYIETDGRVFLVERDGLLDLPEPEEVPFPIDRIAPLAGGSDVWFCTPRLDRHPTQWPSKDVLAESAATPAAVAAVHATMPRVVVEGVCRRGDRILLVKGNRGLTDGLWTLPGGFLRFAETPEEGVLREIREEVGLQGSIVGTPHIHAKLGANTRLHWIMILFPVAVDGTPTPNPDEIAEACFVDVETAMQRLDATLGNAVRAVIEAAATS